jgi:hypothetical protein
VLPDNSGSGAIRLTASIDDGAVFYLNGVEINRYNMPPGPVDRNTRAIVDLDPLACFNTQYLSVTNFLRGTNLLATEVHQSSDPASLDIYFGVEIDAIAAPRTYPALQIERTDTVPGGIVVTWPVTDFPGWGLLAQNPRTTNWTLVATNSPFQTNLIPGASQFYRLAVPASVP